MWIALGQHFALLIQEAERFVAGLMIENREFSEVRSLWIFDHGLPTARHRLAVEGAEIA